VRVRGGVAAEEEPVVWRFDQVGGPVRCADQVAGALVGEVPDREGWRAWCNRVVIASVASDDGQRRSSVPDTSRTGPSIRSTGMGMLGSGRLCRVQADSEVSWPSAVRPASTFELGTSAIKPLTAAG
jgi:hypothetical protein